MGTYIPGEHDILEFQGWIQMISRPKVGNIRNINKSPGILSFLREVELKFEYDRGVAFFV